MKLKDCKPGDKVTKTREIPGTNTVTRQQLRRQDLLVRKREASLERASITKNRRTKSANPAAL